jgi:MraZ protein
MSYDSDNCGAWWVLGGCRVVFQGESEHSLDDKWRVIIPTRLRSSLGERFYMTKGIGGCIFVYTESAYKDMTEKLQKQRDLSLHALRLLRFFTSTESTADNQGRVQIPANLRDWAKIGEQSDVVIVGTGSKIEIWSRDAWIAYNDQLTDAMINESAREVGIA